MLKSKWSIPIALTLVSGMTGLASSAPNSEQSPAPACSDNRVAAGCGTYTWPDGTTYTGDFHGGFFYGHGVIHYSDGSTFEGQFDNCSAHGHAIFIGANGTKLEGELQGVSRDESNPHTLTKFPFWRGLFGDEDRVMLVVLVAEDGGVTNAQVYEPTNFPSFDQAALASVRQWKYLPATLEGQAVKLPYCIEIQFAIAR